MNERMTDQGFDTLPNEVTISHIHTHKPIPYTYHDDEMSCYYLFALHCFTRNDVSTDHVLLLL